MGHVAGLDCPLFVVQRRPAGRSSYLLKKLTDYVAASLALIVLSPLLAVIALLIKLTSRGPVLFADERMGIGRRPFRCVKFRTMVNGAAASQSSLESLNEAGDVLFKIRDDPRVTPVGRVLRRTSLDELPQLWNVLRGEMSLVGPRPLPLRDCSLMQDWHHRRHVVLPGMTGLWQTGGRSDLGFSEMMRLDVQYIDSWSFKSDLLILWRTAGSMFLSRGAF